MKIFGIVSNSPDVLKQIQDVAASVFNTKTTIYKTYCYQDTREIPNIIQNGQEEIEGWIFSGETPYAHAKPYLPKDMPAVSCILNGLEIFRYLLQSLALSKVNALRISIDLPEIASEDWLTVMKEAQVSCE